METKEHKLPFELIVGDETGEIMNGDVPVRWCVTPELVKQLEDDKIIDPHILLVTATEAGGYEMQRQLVPVSELMTYVRFTKAGTMKLYGFVIDGAAGRKDLYSRYNRKSCGDYDTTIMFPYTGKPHDDLFGEYTRTEVTVEIPAGVFGKEPGPWMKWFVNLWHNNSGRVVDQCHFRQRAGLAFTLKWIPVLIWTTFLITMRVLLTGAVALAGYYKNVNFWRSFRPFKYSNVDFHLVPDLDLSDNFFLRKRKYVYPSGYEEMITMWFLMPFNPLLLTVQAIIIIPTNADFFVAMAIVTGILSTVAIVYDLGVVFLKWLTTTTIFEKFSDRINNNVKSLVDYFDTNNRWRYLKWAAFALLATMIGTVAAVFVTVGMFLIPVTIVCVLFYKYGESMLTLFENMYTVAPENNDYTEIRELLCPKDELNLKADVHFIPSKQRTVRLWYLDMKNKVCKPMQQ